MNSKLRFMVCSVFAAALILTSLSVWAQEREATAKAVERIQKEVRHELLM